MAAGHAAAAGGRLTWATGHAAEPVERAGADGARACEKRGRGGTQPRPAPAPPLRAGAERRRRGRYPGRCGGVERPRSRGGGGKRPPAERSEATTPAVAERRRPVRRRRLPCRGRGTNAAPAERGPCLVRGSGGPPPERVPTNAAAGDERTAATSESSTSRRKRDVRRVRRRGRWRRAAGGSPWSLPAVAADRVPSTRGSEKFAVDDAFAVAAGSPWQVERGKFAVADE